MLSRCILLVFIASVLSGCATTEIVNRVPQPPTSLKPEEIGEVQVCRSYIFVGDAAGYVTSIDRKPILRSSAGKCFKAKLQIGNHVLGTLGQGWAGIEMREHEFKLAAGETKYFITRLERIVEVTKSEFTGFEEYTWVDVQ